MLDRNKKTLSDIESRYYFKPMKEILEEKIKNVGEIMILDSLTEVMIDALQKVEQIIHQRKDRGYIEDVAQARKSVAGNGFQGLIAYSLIRLQTANILNPNLVITLKPKRHPLIERCATIRIGDEVQRPDIDMLIYMNTEFEKHPVIIYSIKTSLRERTGQTYRWKLLMDIVTSQNCGTIKNKYNLDYKVTGDIRVGLITANFYNEIMSPQQHGMLKFFDFAYITKGGNWKEPICRFSRIIDDLHSLYWHD